MLISICRFLVRALPTRVAVALIRSLVRRSERPPITSSEQAALEAGTRVNYGRDNAKVAWTWGSGPQVLFVHGWNGRAAQLAPLAQQVAWEGYRSICIDVSAHGESPGEQPSWRHFLDDITEAAAHFGPIHTFVGHSAGALSMMAARAQARVGANGYVCVCAPSHPFPPIRAIERVLDPPSRVLDACREDIAGQFGTTWRELEQGVAWRSALTSLLLIYDRKDRFVDHTDGDRVLGWDPDARLIKTAGHGHTRVLASDELARALIDFLSERAILLRHAAAARR